MSKEGWKLKFAGMSYSLSLVYFSKGKFQKTKNKDPHEAKQSFAANDLFQTFSSVFILIRLSTVVGVKFIFRMANRFVLWRSCGF